jgi:hypothetical protein
MSLQVPLREDQTATIECQFFDERGGRTEAEEGSIQWTREFGNVQLFPAPDGRTCQVYAPLGSAGDARVVAQADADLGAGVRLVTDVTDFVITKREAQQAKVVLVSVQDGPPSSQGGSSGTTPGMATTTTPRMPMGTTTPRMGSTPTTRWP